MRLNCVKRKSPIASTFFRFTDLENALEQVPDTKANSREPDDNGYDDQGDDQLELSIPFLVRRRQ